MQYNFDDIKYLQSEPLSKHTTFRIGGPAKYFFMPKNSDEIKYIINYCKENNERYLILGNGSNVLVADEGFDGCLIQIYNNMNSITVDGEYIYAQAGALLSKVANIARDNSLTGMEFAAGIPGTIGGAIVMNAGAYGGEMKDIVEYVDILEDDGEIKRYACKDMQFEYRKSIVDSNKVVLGVMLKLNTGNIDLINERMDELKNARISKQPLEYPSAGSTFKRPKGYFAAKLIDDCGLRGYRVGGAMVSEKHCGFVINFDNATAKDVMQLMDDIKEQVNKRFGIIIEPEVKIIR